MAAKRLFFVCIVFGYLYGGLNRAVARLAVPFDAVFSPLFSLPPDREKSGGRLNSMSKEKP